MCASLAFVTLRKIQKEGTHVRVQVIIVRSCSFYSKSTRTAYFNQPACKYKLWHRRNLRATNVYLYVPPQTALSFYSFVHFIYLSQKDSSGSPSTGKGFEKIGGVPRCSVALFLLGGRIFSSASIIFFC